MDALGVPLVLKVRQENFLSTAGVIFGTSYSPTAARRNNTIIQAISPDTTANRISLR
jgi:hypothetical protein